MRPLSVEEHDQRLRAECPQFSLVAHAGWMGVWEGTLRPICQTYRIRIVYFSRRVFDGWFLQNPYVSVFVIDPPIGPDPRILPSRLHPPGRIAIASKARRRRLT